MRPGTRLEHYEIIAPIGEGGMGAVYEAEDTRLERRVAVKVLPPELGADPERLARLEREARLLGSLNHPNVATVHGFGQETIEEDGGERPVTFVVMELVEGPSLHERLDTGPLPWKQAVDVAVGIAAGLEAAHEKGIVHRDLKPANVHVTEDGGVKVLDFGLAKAFEGEAASGSLELSASPTVAAATRTGMILGTAAYMSPEQARGRVVDKRADVWALGCVLFEMLTGGKAFSGDTVSDVLASILKEEPDWDALPPIPLRLRHLLERCLAKQPSQRTRDIGDVRLELEAARNETARKGAGDAASTSPALLVAAAVVALVAGLSGGYLLRGAPEPGPEMRLMVSPESIAAGPDGLDISPDGRWIAETAQNDGIRIRSIDDPGWRTIPGTEGGYAMTFSADSRRLYFVVGNNSSTPTLFSAGLDGATPTTEAELDPGYATVFRGLDGAPMIAVGNSQSGDYVISRREPAGGLTEVARPKGPSGALMILTAQLEEDRWLGWTFTGSTVRGLVLAGAGEDEPVELLEGYRTPLSLGSGRILAVDGTGRLVSATIDTRTGAIAAPPVIELEGLGLSSGFAGAYALSDGGMLVYMAGPANSSGTGQTLTWMDRSGGLEPLSQRVGEYQVDSRVSPDGGQLALEIDSAGEVSVWIHDLDRDVQTALTPGLESSFPVWSPDSRELVFRALPEETEGIYRGPVDRSRAPELLLANPDDGFALPMDWSADGSLILYVDSTSEFRSADADRNDLWLLPADGGEPRPFVATAAAEVDGRFSPDGRWIAYASNQTGRYEIYLRAVEGGAEYRLSADGGTSPEWNQAGGELFFTRSGTMMVVDIDTSGATPSVSAERVLATLPANLRQNLYAPHPDGERFLVGQYGQVDATAVRSVRAILNWSPLQR